MKGFLCFIGGITGASCSRARARYHRLISDDRLSQTPSATVLQGLAGLLGGDSSKA